MNNETLKKLVKHSKEQELTSAQVAEALGLPLRMVNAAWIDVERDESTAAITNRFLTSAEVE